MKICPCSLRRSSWWFPVKDVSEVALCNAARQAVSPLPPYQSASMIQVLLSSEKRWSLSLREISRTTFDRSSAWLTNLRRRSKMLSMNLGRLHGSRRSIYQVTLYSEVHTYLEWIEEDNSCDDSQDARQSCFEVTRCETSTTYDCDRLFYWEHVRREISRQAFICSFPLSDCLREWDEYQHASFKESFPFLLH